MFCVVGIVGYKIIKNLKRKDEKNKMDYALSSKKRIERKKSTQAISIAIKDDKSLRLEQF